MVITCAHHSCGRRFVHLDSLILPLCFFFVLLLFGDPTAQQMMLGEGATRYDYYPVDATGEIGKYLGTTAEEIAAWDAELKDFIEKHVGRRYTGYAGQVCVETADEKTKAQPRSNNEEGWLGWWPTRQGRLQLSRECREEQGLKGIWDYIVVVAVLPELQGRGRSGKAEGIGTSLMLREMKALRDAARAAEPQKKIQGIWLKNTIDSKRQFYQRLGFKPTGVGVTFSITMQEVDAELKRRGIE